MNEETINKAMELLEVLAVKMGTTADHLWEILIKQAYVNFAVEMIRLYAIVAGVVYLIKVSKKMYAWTTEDDKYGSRGIIACMFALLIGLIGVAFISESAEPIINAIKGALNPEHFAFKEITKLIGGW